MKVRPLFLGAGLLCWLATVPAPAQQPGSPPDRVLLFASDTMGADAVALSPDQRWLAMSVLETPSTASLWMQRVGSGPPQRLTASGRWDDRVEWSPAGDRLYFISNRPARAGDPYYYGMVLPIDPATGRPAGEPRQVTADAVRGGVHASPDGRFLAYFDARNPRELKVIPAAGGAARVVARVPERTFVLTWADNRHLAYATSFPSEGRRVVSRISVDGGEPVVVARLEVPAGPFLLIGPGAERFVLHENGDGPRDRVIKLVDRSGKVLKTLRVNRNTRAHAFTANGRGLVALENNVVAPTRVMPITGGAYREVTPPIAYDWVMAWSPDGSAVYTWTEDKNQIVLARVPVAGGSRKDYPEGKDWGFEGVNSRYLIQASKRQGATPRQLFALDLKDGTRHTISESLPAANSFPYGPGGTWAAHEELLFLERNGNRVHVKGWSGPGKVRTLRSLSPSILDKSNVAVHGDRVAWQQARGDSLDLLIADGPNAQPRRLLSMSTRPSNEISFSRDGKLLAMHYSTGPGSPDLMAIVDADGRTAPHIIETGLSYWYWPRWLPDHTGVLVIGGGAGAEANVVLVPVRNGAKPVNVTRDDPSMKWGFELSPDGRFIAYPGEIWKGSSIWKFDLEAPARAARAMP